MASQMVMYSLPVNILARGGGATPSVFIPDGLEPLPFMFPWSFGQSLTRFVTRNPDFTRVFCIWKGSCWEGSYSFPFTVSLISSRSQKENTETDSRFSIKLGHDSEKWFFCAMSPLWSCRKLTKVTSHAICDVMRDITMDTNKSYFFSDLLKLWMSSL